MPAHCGQATDVPPMTNQPPLPPATFVAPPRPAFVSYTSGPVRELASEAMSGTPRIAPIGVEPVGRLSW